MIDDWIDTLTKVWAIDNGKGGTLKSFALFERAEFPAALPSLADSPCVLSFVTGATPHIGAAQSTILWSGISEFHLTPDLDRAQTPYILRFYERILRAAAANVTLGGKVNHFILPSDTESINGPLRLRYGAEAEHLGLIVDWQVKEHLIDLVVTA